MRVGSGWALKVPGQRRRGAWQRWTARLCLLGAYAAAEAQAGGGAAWRQAMAARAAFEAEPVGTHTRAAYAGVLDRFRAIYHGDPASVYAPRAVDAVAALLAEEGRELKDRKALRDAAGQYEFLARAYPESTLAPPGLGAALALLGPDAAGDTAEAGRVRALLERRYPRSAAAKGAGDTGVVDRKEPALDGASSVEAENSRFPVREMTDRKTDSAGGTSVAPLSVRGGLEERRSPAGMTTKRAEAEERAESVFAAGSEGVDDQRRVPGAAPAMVTGIRHWSTATYTRVAIDLGGEVEFQAARVEHPDRIFFDLHGAKLAPGLAGKSFAITDEGFLKTIRAGQAGADVTRIVLEVQPVAEYSAFLLPNPTRLIIDVHGRAAGESGSPRVGEPVAARARGGDGAAEPEAAPDSRAGGDGAAPVVRVDPHALKSTGNQVSSLPPMAVTDGSASFGLPPKRTQAAPSASADVARPRVVVSAQPTAARPVPNSVSSAAPRANREVAAVSEGPGVIAATPAPTSRPVVDKAKGRELEGGSRDPRELTGKRRAQPAIIVAGTPALTGSPAAPAPPTADGQSTLMRALGLKIGRIVIDPGHGGHDSGTLGADGIEEKDVVLDVALRLGKLLHDRLGAEIVYTRADDTFIPLETRTAIANKAQADLFISVHANSSADPNARGVEVYYLKFTSDPEAMAVAGRENAVSSGRVNQLSDLVKKIALKDKIDESRELAADVDQSLYGGLKRGNGGLKDRGVKKAPFVVLIGANMPSILAEISFVTNPDDAHQLGRPEYRERVAESLYGGVARYAATINGVPGEAKARGTERALR